MRTEKLSDRGKCALLFDQKKPLYPNFTYIFNIACNKDTDTHTRESCIKSFPHFLIEDIREEEKLQQNRWFIGFSYTHYLYVFGHSDYVLVAACNVLLCCFASDNLSDFIYSDTQKNFHVLYIIIQRQQCENKNPAT